MRTTLIRFAVFVMLLLVIGCSPKISDNSIDVDTDITDDIEAGDVDSQFGEDLDDISGDVQDSDLNDLEKEISEIDSIETDLNFDELSDEDFEIE